MQTRKARWAVAAFVVAAITSGLTTTSGTAVAAPRPAVAPTADVTAQAEIDPAGPPDGFDGFVVTAQAADASGGARAARPVITCWGDTDRPHRSSTNPRRANVHVWIKCTARVSQITVWGKIYRDGRLAGVSAKTHTTRGRSIARNHANTACRDNHVYGSWVGGSVVFPPRYTPPVGRISKVGKSHRITNCP